MRLLTPRPQLPCNQGQLYRWRQVMCRIPLVLFIATFVPITVVDGLISTAEAQRCYGNNCMRGRAPSMPYVRAPSMPYVRAPSLPTYRAPPMTRYQPMRVAPPQQRYTFGIPRSPSVSQQYYAPRVVVPQVAPRSAWRNTYGAVGGVVGHYYGGDAGGIAGHVAGDRVGDYFYRGASATRYYNSRAFGTQTTTPYMIVPRQ